MSLVEFCGILCLMSGTPEIFKDGFGPRWRVVEAFDLRTGAKLFSMPNTVYQGNLITAGMQPSGPEMKALPMRPSGK